MSTTRPAPSPAGRAPAASPAAPVSLGTVRSLLAGLNAEQRLAVTHGDGPLLVVAGPGTGKTHVVTRRIAWLIATKRAKPREILALTFTDKAAEEMQARVDALVPYGQADVHIATFHAWGDRLVREHGFELGLPGEPRVLSRTDAIVFLRERLWELGLDRYRPLGDPTRFLGALVDLFARARDEDVSPDAFAAYAAQRASDAAAALESRQEPAQDSAAALLDAARAEGELAAAYRRYAELMTAARCIDFADQVALALRLLRERPAVRAKVQRGYRYVLVDEFQDTNPAQLELLCQVVGPDRNITVVGDDDQSIYTFRGAALSNVLGFADRFPGTRHVVLRRNYRSTRPILDAAARLIAHNDPWRLGRQAGLDKGLRAQRRLRGKPVVERGFCSAADEADWIADEIRRRLDAGAAASDLAVLVRANADADPILRSLNVAGIPWRSGGRTGLFVRPEVRELLAWLRAVAAPDSTVDVYAVAASAPYRLPAADLTRLMEHVRRRHRSLWSVLDELEEQPGIVQLSSAGRRAALRLVRDLRAALELAQIRPAGEVLYDHLRRSGRLARLAAADSAEAVAEARNVARLFDLVRTRTRLLADDRVAFLVPHLADALDAGDDPQGDGADEEADAVSVLTVHRAKGLEFATVFVAGLSEGRFPARGRREVLALPDELRRDRRLVPDEAPHAEERRLCYVALTRARDELILTWSAETASGRRRRPSPFVAEALGAEPAMPARRDGMALAPQPPPAAAVKTHSRRRLSAPLELSYSQIDDYLTCPRRYDLRHERRLPVPAHHALAYGTALHAAVAALNQRRARGDTVPLDDVLEVYRTHWTSDGFLSREHEEARYAAGEAALRRFHAHELASPTVASAVEARFAFDLEGTRIRGRFDRVDGEGRDAVITDYKSGDVRDADRARERARDSLQLAIYALAHEAQSGSRPAATQLHFLDSGVVGRVEVEDRRLERARRSIATAAAGIRAKAFEATPDAIACALCPFRRICPDSAA